MLLKEIIDIIEFAAPLSAQESWDNSGLQIGHKEDDVTTVLLCTDVTECIIQEAYAKGAELVISHHPLLYHGLKTLQQQTPQQRITEYAIRHGIAVYSSHTAVDVQPDGVSGYAVSLLGITDGVILSPYGAETGIGIIGTLPEPMLFDALLKLLAETFGQRCIRYSNPTDKPVRRLAFVGGSGAELAADATEHGADVFVSADFKHHDFTDWAGGIPLVDIGHWESEHLTKHIFRRLLEPTGLTLLDAESDRSPAEWYVKGEN